MNTKTSAVHALERFRQEVYQHALTRRRDALFELLEAALASSGPRNLAHLSLAPVFHRRWASAPDALADGRLAPGRIRALLRSHIPPPPDGARPVWALDGTVWPRPAAATSPERTYGHWASRGLPQDGVIPAWEYQWLGLVPDPGASWFLPLDVARRGPTEATPTALALRQLRRVRRRQPQGSPRPVVALDSTYDVSALARAVQADRPSQRLDADVLVRLNPRRRFYRRPGPYAGRGRRPVHGAVVRLPDPTTHGEPEGQATAADPTHGQVRVSVWRDLHPQDAATVTLTLVKVEVERLPRSGHRPKPLWLAWIGGPLPADLLDLWRWYRLRFVCEHAFRFVKQDLGWTTVRPRWPAAADRWTWLVVLALWHLWLAQDLVADQRLPWERPLPSAHLTPGRVRRATGAILAGLSHPPAAVRPRGNSPGRAQGAGPGPRQRFRVVKRGHRTLHRAA